ncbi:murein hydrolase activator NlpD [Vibrio sp. ZSDZ65]|uniref:Murein hydrolase activator NlpD n=1 Tax=Vibrio qingdaonensis TaxID=2829491 RepID=A0A9X3CKY3_9VIBR|nr:murein hydrolase activator NlpD [Vibrio qingdaonensis]MCW8345181.1 murein hydrolase activator NlpD [Vibrio qingdaonensis]
MRTMLRRAVWVLSLTSVLAGCTGYSRAPVSDLGGKYESVSRGSYRGSFYEVQKGDTLYFISYVTNKDVKELIRLNNLQAPYTIHPGDRLNLWRSVYSPPSYAGSGAGEAAATTAAASTVSPKPKPVAKKPASSTSNSAQKTVNKKVEQSKAKEYGDSKGKQNVNNTKPNTAKQKAVASKPKTTAPAATAKVSSWVWPTKGRVIKNFSVGDQGNKGIDIAGQRGQAIVATAGGTVVYSGNALRGYGNLVIVKHNDSYLSAYAHNDRLLVSEGQSVKSGQKIATMGSSGSNSVRLHFEIRYQGKSVNPKRYLP